MKKDAQAIQREKRTEAYNRALMDAKTKWDIDSQKAAAISANRLQCISLATSAIKDDDDPLELAQKLEKFVNEPILNVVFNAPELPTVDSKIKLLD